MSHYRELRKKITYGYLINAENAPGSIKYHFMRAFLKLKMGGVYFHIKATHIKPALNIIQ